ncbi:MAG: zinc metallopeptidase [Clostridia bacterium]|nr:zinc metallopeptidase [Clostridia bacterium]
MESWLKISMIVSFSLLFVIFLFVLRARQKFFITKTILKPVILNSNKSVYELFKFEQKNDIIKNVKIYEGERYSFYPKSNTVIIEKNCLQSTSLFDVTATAHELGHAYANYRKSALSSLWYVLKIFEKLFCWAIIPLFLVGFVFSFIPNLSFYGTILLNTSSAISLVVLIGRFLSIPTEKEASKYGLWILNNAGFLTKNELKMSKKMLKIALSTYVFAFYERLFHNFILIKKIIFKIFRIKPKAPKLSLKSKQEVNDLVLAIKKGNAIREQEQINQQKRAEEQAQLLREEQLFKEQENAQQKKIYDPNEPTMYDIIFKRANEQKEVQELNDDDIIKMPHKEE